MKMTLKTYYEDWEENECAWKRRANWKEANKVMKKLRRHFKIPWDSDGQSALFVNNRKGSASVYGNRINLPKNNISLGMMAHEVAHIVQHKKYNNIGHNKKFKKALKIVNNYIKRKNYFDKEVKWEGKHKVIKRDGRISVYVNNDCAEFLNFPEVLK